MKEFRKVGGDRFFYFHTHQPYYKDLQQFYSVLNTSCGMGILPAPGRARRPSHKNK
ncbi:hypothetical protein [Nostoc sp.]|uniref:hypothetical protein n=1 Tax=Nostoc sp. TaxID=1180 RepID=UPI002FFD0E85